MMSLFSSFDNFFYWASTMPFFISIIFLSSIIFKLNLTLTFITLIKNFMSKFFISLGDYKSKFFDFIVLTLFYMIFFFNYFSVFPFVYPAMSSVGGVLFLSLVSWSSIMLFSLKSSIKSFLSHQIPEGTPMPLTWFIFLIELVSQSIRPITLTVRLVANILSGHLLMILLSKLVFMYMYSSIFYMILNLIEMFVSLIQAYIFVTLIYLYYLDIW